MALEVACWSPQPVVDLAQMARVAPVSFQNTAASVLTVLSRHLHGVREDGTHHSSTQRARLAFRVPGRVSEFALARAIQEAEKLRDESYTIGDVEWKCVAEGGTEAFLYVHLMPLGTRKRQRSEAGLPEDSDPFLDCDDPDDEEGEEEGEADSGRNNERKKGEGDVGAATGPGDANYPLLQWARTKLSLTKERLRPAIAWVHPTPAPEAQRKTRKTRRAARQEIVERMHVLASRGHAELQDAATRVPEDTQRVADLCNVPVRAYFRFQLMIEALHAVLWGACRDARRPMCRAWPRWQVDRAAQSNPTDDADEDRQCRCVDLVPPTEELCMSLPLLLRIGMSNLREQSYTRPYSFVLTFGPTTVRFTVTHKQCPLHAPRATVNSSSPAPGSVP